MPKYFSLYMQVVILHQPSCSQLLHILDAQKKYLGCTEDSDSSAERW